MCSQTGALTNETIINMVQAGVPTATIIHAIAAAGKVGFTFVGPLSSDQYYDYSRASAGNHSSCGPTGHDLAHAPRTAFRA